MLILGTTRLTFTKSKGTFHCPQCTKELPYRHRTVRNFFTVYFIPLIPLNLESEYVECGQCRGKFEPSVVDVTAEEFVAKQKQAAYELIRRGLVTILVLDDIVSDEELDVIRDFVRDHMQRDIDNDHMLSEAARVQQMGISPADYIASISAELEQTDRDVLVRYAFLLATANGELDEAHQQLLLELPNLIGMDQARYRDIIADL
jgi:uncharacterized tellurite resistance protein B-like protein